MVKADLTRDYYGDLEISPTADVAEIKKQFKKLALAYHPDRNPGRESEVTAKFQKIQSAHEVLTDTAERAKYDANRVRASYRPGQSSGVKGNPWANVSSQYPTPPKPPTARNRAHPPPPPPPSAGAERYKKNFQTPNQSAYQSAQEGPEARESTYKAWENLRHANKADPGLGNPGPGKTWNAPRPPPRGTPKPGREESNARTHAPPPRSSFEDFREANSPRPRSHSSHTATRKGFMPTGRGDEPPAPTGSYFSQRKSANPPPPPPREPPPSGNPIPENLRRHRDSAIPPMEERTSTPYSTHGGDKLNPFEGANINRSKSTRERNEGFGNNQVPRADSDSNLAGSKPQRAKSFAARSSSRRTSKPAFNTVNLDSSSSDDLPEMNGSGSRLSGKRNGAPRNSQQEPNAPMGPETSKQSKISKFRQWMKENPGQEPPPDGFPPDGPPLRSDQPNANGEPTMYATSDPFDFNPPDYFFSGSARSRTSSYSSKLPTVSETISSSGHCFGSRFDSHNSNSKTYPNLFRNNTAPSTPSGVTFGPDCLNAFEGIQRNIVDQLLNNKHPSSSSQKSGCPSAGMPQNGCRQKPATENTPAPSAPSDNWTGYRDSAEAGSPSKKFKPLKHLHSVHAYDCDKSRSFWDSMEKMKSNANNGQNSRFSFNVPQDAFNRTNSNGFASSSAENISTKFTPEDWDGKFEAGGEYFKPEQKAAGVPPRARAQSGGRSRGRSPIKVKPVDARFMQPQVDEEPVTESPHGTRFSADEWKETFKPQTFAPPIISPQFRKRPSLRTTMGGNAAVVDESSGSDEKPLFTDRKPNISPPNLSPEPMDVDTPPAAHTVPQFANQNLNAEPLKRPAASASQSPTDTETLKVNFDDLQIRDLITSLNLPTPPPAPVVAYANFERPTPAAYEEYVKRYEKYMTAWDLFEKKFTLHEVSRQRQNEAWKEKRWQDERITEQYRLGLKQDLVVRNRWNESVEAHELVVREWVVMKEKMKTREAINGAAAAEGETRRPKKKTH